MLLRITLVLILSVNSASQASERSGQPVVLAVHPYLAFQDLQKRYKPLADYLAKALNTEVVVRIGRDYGEHIMYIGKDHVDIAYLGPAAYVRMVEKYGKKDKETGHTNVEPRHQKTFSDKIEALVSQHVEVDLKVIDRALLDEGFEVEPNTMVHLPWLFS